MYESHYGLTAKPFSLVPNPAYLFLGKNHENALTYLEYGFTQKVGFILLTGEIGAGKTTLIRHMLNEVESEMDVAVIFNTNFSSDQLFRRVLGEFEIPCGEEGKERYLERLYEFLIERYAKGRHVILIVDEAQNLPDESLEDLRMLSNLQTDDHILLQIMLVGQPELRERLGEPKFKQLVQRIAVNYHITPLDEQQTVDYIDYRLKKAGCSKNLFTPAAIRKIYKHSGGIPRTINLVCDTALVYGYAENTLKDHNGTGRQSHSRQGLSVSGKRKTAPTFPVKGKTTETAQPGVEKRMAQLERSLSQLEQKHETFVQEVKTDLTRTYKKLLDAERKRFDRLLAKLDHLFIRTGSTAERSRNGDPEKPQEINVLGKPTIHPEQSRKNQ
jgi:general secretion pathway protein A